MASTITNEPRRVEVSRACFEELEQALQPDERFTHPEQVPWGLLLLVPYTGRKVYIVPAR